MRPPRQERHHALDLLRGLAALGIAVYHWLSWERGLTIRSLGTFGVYVFFILSALTMAMVYANAFGERIEIRDVRNFFRNRAARLLPLLALATAAAFALAVYKGAATPGRAAKAVLTGSGLFSLTPAGFTEAAPGSWSLGIELAFYAVVPAAVLVVVQSSLRAVMLALLVSLAAQHAYLFVIETTPEITQWDYYTVPLTFAPFFLAGFAVFKTGERVSVAWLPAVLALFGVLACWSLVVPGEITRQHGAYLALTVVAGLTVFAAWRTEIPATVRPVAALMGNASYALYLTHPFTAIVVGFAGRRMGLPPADIMAIYLVAALGVAAATYALFETRARDWLRGRHEKVATLP